MAPDFPISPGRPGSPRRPIGPWKSTKKGLMYHYKKLYVKMNRRIAFLKLESSICDTDFSRRDHHGIKVPDKEEMEKEIFIYSAE